MHCMNIFLVKSEIKTRASVSFSMSFRPGAIVLWLEKLEIRALRVKKFASLDNTIFASPSI